jgi:methionine aminopeptidase
MGTAPEWCGSGPASEILWESVDMITDIDVADHKEGIHGDCSRMMRVRSRKWDLWESVDMITDIDGAGHKEGIHGDSSRMMRVRSRKWDLWESVDMITDIDGAGYQEGMKELARTALTTPATARQNQRSG